MGHRDLWSLEGFSDRVISLDLIDASSNVKLTSLTDGTVIASTANPSFPSALWSTEKAQNPSSRHRRTANSNGTTTNQIENKALYTLCANSFRNATPCTDLGIGQHTVGAKACPKSKGRGKCTDPLKLSFQIVQSPVTKAHAAPPNAPVAVPGSLPVTPMVPSVASPVAPIVPVVDLTTSTPGSPMAPLGDSPIAPIAPFVAPSLSRLYYAICVPEWGTHAPLL